MRIRWRSVTLVAMIAFIGVVASRLYFGPLRYLAPIGRCIDGGIDLNNPIPFSRARFGGTVVGLAASGGGSRAAYLEAAILREIRRAGPRLQIGRPSSEPRSLLDQIDAISAVSGGSLAAAYFTLHAEKLLEADAEAEGWKSFLDKMAIEYRKRQWYGPAALVLPQ